MRDRSMSDAIHERRCLFVHTLSKQHKVLSEGKEAGAIGDFAYDHPVHRNRARPAQLSTAPRGCPTAAY